MCIVIVDYKIIQEKRDEDLAYEKQMKELVTKLAKKWRGRYRHYERSLESSSGL